MKSHSVAKQNEKQRLCVATSNFSTFGSGCCFKPSDCTKDMWISTYGAPQNIQTFHLMICTMGFMGILAFLSKMNYQKVLLWFYSYIHPGQIIIMWAAGCLFILFWRMWYYCICIEQNDNSWFCIHIQTPTSILYVFGFSRKCEKVGYFIWWSSFYEYLLI